jgi:hypothetical protein
MAVGLSQFFTVLYRKILWTSDDFCLGLTEYCDKHGKVLLIKNDCKWKLLGLARLEGVYYIHCRLIVVICCSLFLSEDRINYRNIQYSQIPHLKFDDYSSRVFFPLIMKLLPVFCFHNWEIPTDQWLKAGGGKDWWNRTCTSYHPPSALLQTVSRREIIIYLFHYTGLNSFKAHFYNWGS